MPIINQRTANNRINTDWQFRCAPSPAGYAERYVTKLAACARLTG
jgi:hypothetical protein